jgi:FAD/FMN-containing dehydrogenase
VGWQVQQLVKELSAAGAQGFDARVGSTADPLWHALTESPARPASRLTFKANLLPHAVAAFCREGSRRHDGVLLHAHAGSGIVTGQTDGDLTLDDARSMLKGLQELAQQAQGNVVLLRCPTEWKRSLPVWGVPRGDAWLMRAVKEKLDPRNLFNPGRFVNAI